MPKRRIDVSDGYILSEFYTTGQIGSGIVHGDYEKYYSDGKIAVRTKYNLGYVDGFYQTYNKNGEIEMYQYMKNGMIQGLKWQLSFDSQSAMVTMYLNDKKHGEFINIFADGQYGIHCYCANDELVHDFLKNPLSENEKILLVLEHGGRLIPKQFKKIKVDWDEVLNIKT